jgi:hypothetical protein
MEQGWHEGQHDPNPWPEIMTLQKRRRLLVRTTLNLTPH